MKWLVTMPKRFLNRPVDAAVPWPRSRVSIQYGEWEIIASPSSKEVDLYLHIDINQRNLDIMRGASILSQILSICSWLEDQYAVLLDGWSGNPIPVQGRRQTANLVRYISDGWSNNWAALPTAPQRLAMAIYREARNMEHFHSQPYALLGYFRILEYIYPTQPQRGEKLVEYLFSLLEKEPLEDYYLKALELDQQPTPARLRKILEDEGRHAVAHAKGEPIINPDDLGHQHKMSAAINLLRPLTRKLMHLELQISFNPWNQNEK